MPGERVTSGRHYFDCGGVLPACWDALADGDPADRDPRGNPSAVVEARTECRGGPFGFPG